MGIPTLESFWHGTLSDAADPLDHDVGGLDERGRRITLLQLQFSSGVGGDDRRDPLIADREHYLSQQSHDPQVGNLAGQLVSSADAAIAFPGSWGGLFPVSCEKGLQSGLGDAVMSARRPERLQFAAQDPLFDGGIANAEQPGGISRLQ